MLHCSNYYTMRNTIPGIDSCLMVTKWDFLEMEASLWLNGRSQNVAKGCLSTECCWEAAVHTLDLSWREWTLNWWWWWWNTTWYGGGNSWYGSRNSTTAEEVSRLQPLFSNLSWFVWGRASHHQKLAPTFPWIDNCLMVTKRDFLEIEASLWLKWYPCR